MVGACKRLHELEGSPGVSLKILRVFIVDRGNFSRSRGLVEQRALEKRSEHINRYLKMLVLHIKVVHLQRIVISV